MSRVAFPIAFAVTLFASAACGLNDSGLLNASDGGAQGSSGSSGSAGSSDDGSSTSGSVGNSGGGSGSGSGSGSSAASGSGSADSSSGASSSGSGSGSSGGSGSGSGSSSGGGSGSGSGSSSGSGGAADGGGDGGNDAPGDSSDASDAAIDAGPLSFATDVYPILTSRCIACHTPGGGGVTMGHLDYTTNGAAGAYSQLMMSAMGTVAGGAGLTCRSSALMRVVPGSAVTSLLFNKVDSKLMGALALCGNPMPAPTTAPALTAAQVTTIQNWIDQGANP